MGDPNASDNQGFLLEYFFFYPNYWKLFIVEVNQLCVEKIKWFLVSWTLQMSL